MRVCQGLWRLQLCCLEDSIAIDLCWSELAQANVGLLYRIEEVLSGLGILFILVLDVGNVIIANASCLVVDSIKHVAGLS